MKRNSHATIAEEVRLILRYKIQDQRLLFYPLLFNSLSRLHLISHQLNLSLRRNGIAVCFEWVQQSIEYLSRKGLTSNNPESLSGKVYLLFLESDLHEISSEDGILPHNVQQIESGMLSSSNDILVLQVRVVITLVEQYFRSRICLDVLSR